ncbi:MAG: hypothetical protein JWO72_1056 [Caulobacteraceae bacterium]|jgi:hypothetical protein|nr:hypothetical protein [Caulobacteraceae bacterium]
MKKTITRALAGAALASLWTLSAQAAEEIKPVKLPLETQHKLGFVVQPLLAATRTATIPGFARVLDPSPLAQLDSDIQTAQAAAAASAAQAARSKILNADDQAISTKALQAAQAQASADASRLALLRRRVGLEWGEGLARMSDRQRGVLVADLAAGRAALVRIDTASGQGQAGLRGVDIDFGSLGLFHGAVLGAARAADPRLMSPGLIARIGGKNAGLLSNGLAAPVKLTASGPVRGVVAPRGALLRSGGETWLYVRTAQESFLRKPVERGIVDPGGLFVPAGFRPGEQVVTAGSAALFAAETNVGEAGGD